MISVNHHTKPWHLRLLAMTHRSSLAAGFGYSEHTARGWCPWNAPLLARFGLWFQHIFNSRSAPGSPCPRAPQRRLLQAGTEPCSGSQPQPEHSKAGWGCCSSKCRASPSVPAGREFLFCLINGNSAPACHVQGFLTGIKLSVQLLDMKCSRTS